MRLVATAGSPYQELQARLPIQHELTLAPVGRVSRLQIKVPGRTEEKIQGREEEAKQVCNEYNSIGFSCRGGSNDQICLWG
jgi:hypothetical protein